MRLNTFLTTAVVSLSLTSFLHADPMLRPTAATTNMGNFGGSGPINAINQSGMASTYTSGVTNFDTFVSATSTVGGGNSNNIFYSTTTTGNFDFDLGGSQTIQSLALWTDPQTTVFQGVKNFNLIAASDSSFTTPIALGSFVAAAPVGVGTAEPNNFGQIFTFAPTSASFVRMQITSNYGSTLTTAISEAAFELSIPEPTMLGVMGLLAGGLMRRRRC